MFRERTGLIVWVTDLKPARNLERFGAVHYMSKKMLYVVLYVFSERLEETIRQLQRLPYVKKVERSYRNEIKTEYKSQAVDKTRFYSY